MEDAKENSKLVPAKKSPPLRIMVASVLDNETVILNKGGADGIGYGQRFLLYAVGDEIIDPETNKSLGHLEIVKGTGRVVHLQDTMCTVKSDMKSRPLRTITRKTGGGGGFAMLLAGLSAEVVEEELPPNAVPFSDAARGDLARPI